MSTNLEFYFNDDGFDLLDNEPTMEMRIAHREKQARMLRRSKFGDEQRRRALSERLYECKPGHRCRSAACAECRYAFKRLATSMVNTVWPSPLPLMTYGLMLPSLHRPVGQLSTVPVSEVAETALGLLHKAGCGGVPLIGYVDLCLDVDGDGHSEPQWTPHVHFLTPARFGVDLSSRLVRVLPKEPRTKRPCRGRAVRDRSRQIPYVFKTSFIKDVRFAASSPWARPTTQGLKPRQEVEQLLWLGSSSLFERLVVNLPVRRSPIHPWPTKFSGPRQSSGRAADICDEQRDHDSMELNDH